MDPSGGTVSGGLQDLAGAGAAPPAAAAAAAAAPAVPEVFKFQQVFQLIKSNAYEGELRVHPTGMAFRNTKTSKVIQVHTPEMAKARWMRVARGNQLRLMLKNGTAIKLDGFKNSDREILGEFFEKHYGITIKDAEPFVKGWNWGEYVIVKNNLALQVDKKPIFEVPLNAVSHAHAQKSDAILEFHPVENVGREFQMIESMRFQFPDRDAEDEDGTQADEFVRKVLAKADVMKITGQPLCKFSEVHSLLPRGRYEIQLFPRFMRLHGKTYDFKINYDSIIRLFLLQRPDQRYVYFVLSLDTPIRQGQTRYPFLVFQFEVLEETSTELFWDSLEQVEDAEVKEQLQQRMAELRQQSEQEDGESMLDGKLYEVMSRLFKALTKRKLTVPGSFRSSNSANAVKCTFKANDGFLYPLENGFLFVYKPTIYIRREHIKHISFERVKDTASTNRSFDIEIEEKDGTTHEFHGIQKEEYVSLFEFFQLKKIPVKNVKQHADAVMDDDFSGGSDDEDDVPDAYMQQIRAERAAADSDDGTTSDESFNAEDESDSSAREEYDSNPSSTDSDDDDDEEGGEEGDDGEKKEKKKKKKEKKEKKDDNAMDEGGDGDDDDGEASSKKAKSKPTRKRKKKDPNAPKRPQSAYFLWAGENRERLKSENPELKMTELASLMGQKWGELTAEDKVPYEEKFQEAKAAYAVQMEAYKANKGDSSGDDDDDEGASSSPKKKVRKSKDKNAPKRPQSSYMLWFNANRDKLKEENPDMDFKELGRKAGETWKTLDAEAKAPYEAEAKELKDKYTEAVAKYQEERKARGEVDEETPKKKKSKKAASDKGQTKLEFKSSSTKQYKSKETIDTEDEEGLTP